MEESFQTDESFLTNNDEEDILDISTVTDPLKTDGSSKIVDASKAVSDPTPDPSTVIDTYLENIDESFTKEEEVEYLLHLLDTAKPEVSDNDNDEEEEGEINQSRNENVGISSEADDEYWTDDEKMMKTTPGSSSDSSSGSSESLFFNRSSCRTSTLINPTTPPRSLTPDLLQSSPPDLQQQQRPYSPKVVRRIGPPFVFRSDGVPEFRSNGVPEFRSEDSSDRSDDCEPPSTPSRRISSRSLYVRDQTAEDAMEFVCGLICVQQVGHFL